jgi:amidohydrolase
MAVINRIAAFHSEMVAWRHDIHAHPETAFEEHRTADVVAEKLVSFGLPIHRGLAGTGVVATLKVGDSPRRIGLRADLDALHMEELNSFDWRSRHKGKMHACGHDGHTTMLLGAAKYLAETKSFDGTVDFIFQPAEEGEGGGRVMVEEGLFELFPADRVFGMHNMPGIKTGAFGIRAGALLASSDSFEVIVQGTGAHAAMPHKGVDPMVCAAAIVQGWQTIASRMTSPLESAVVSVTQIHAGEAWNVIPDSVLLRGSARSFTPEIRDMIEESMGRIARGIASGYGCSVEFHYFRRYPPTVNSATETDMAIQAAIDIVGADQVDTDVTPAMAAEDFSFMLQAKPGAYIFIGNGESTPGVHNPHYDFNDEILPIGASYFARLVEQQLAR